MMNRIAFNGSSYLVINSAGKVIETCHNMATARHYARKMKTTKPSWAQDVDAYLASNPKRIACNH